MPVINKSAVELLAPAGSFEALTAAVANGADAVYLGTREFNARTNARNFSLEELGEAVDRCHQRGVRVYLTMNILVKNQEVGRYFDVLSRACSLGIDGVIVQHISFLETIKAGFPGLPVFISTQAAIGNVSAASLVKSADRVILPRELSLAEIRAIAASGTKVEVFVHGALCFSYSGLCLFSSFVSNRSGNRGSCAQLCRQKFNGSYPLSTRELCLVRRLPELIEAGVTGFKIEGRMRSPLYVAVATRLYRRAIDSYLAGRFEVPLKEMAEIEVVFNREFTEGFAFDDAAMLSPEKSMNRGAFLGSVQAGEVVLERGVAVGDGVGIWSHQTVTGATVKTITAGGREVDSAAAGQRVTLGVGAKDGARLYLTSSGRIRIEPDFRVERAPIRTEKRARVEVKLPPIPARQSPAVQILVKAYSLSEAKESVRAGADRVFYDVFAPDFPVTGRGLGLGAYLPRIMSQGEMERALALLRKTRPPSVMSGNPGILAHRREFDAPVYLDYTLNTFNDLDRRYFQRFQATPVLSPELSLSELSAFRNKDAVVLVHGDIPLVNTRIALPAETLRDEKGLVFPVWREDGYWQVLNSRPFGVFNDICRLYEMGFRQFYIDRRGEGPRFADLYRTMLEKDVPDRRLRKHYTSGHLYRPVA